MTTLRSVIAYLASMVRCAAIVYAVAQVAIWHSFYAADSWRLTAVVLAVAWAAMMVTRLRRRWPSPLLACADSAVYVALAIGGQQCVPPAVRDDAFSWLVISIPSQLMVSVWYGPAALFPLLAVASPAAYWAGAMMLRADRDTRTLTGAAVLLAVIGACHAAGRRVLYRRAAAADAALRGDDQAAGEQYAILSAAIERREHERLLHDTVLNTLTALSRAGGADVGEVMSRCQQDVALIEDALGDSRDLADGARRPSGDLVGEVRAVAADMRARGLTVHVEAGDRDVPTVPDQVVPARVVRAISNAIREALSNVVTHAGTGEAWVQVRLMAPDGPAEGPVRLTVDVRDRGRGFDLARVDRARLGLRRSITERIADCGGQASVWSAPGQGTTVRLSWPAEMRPGQPLPAGRPRGDPAPDQEGPPW